MAQIAVVEAAMVMQGMNEHDCSNMACAGDFEPDNRLVPCSGRSCLPLKLAMILEGSRSRNGLEQTSMAAALGDMFPADLTPLIDMSGKMHAHTVRLDPDM